MVSEKKETGAIKGSKTTTNREKSSKDTFRFCHHHEVKRLNFECSSPSMTKHTRETSLQTDFALLSHSNDEWRGQDEDEKKLSFISLYLSIYLVHSTPLDVNLLYSLAFLSFFLFLLVSESTFFSSV